MLGYGVEAEARADPTIRLLSNQLAVQLPELSARLQERQRFLAHGPGGVDVGFVRDGEFNVFAQKRPDGSLVQPTPDALKTVDAMLDRDGHDTLFRAEVKRQILDAPENVPVEVSETVTVVKWQITHLTLALGGPLMNIVVPIKIAYEFLALHLGTAIYEEIPPLVDARRLLRGESLIRDTISVDRLEAPAAQPFHGIAFERNSPYARFQVRLFGKLAFRVHFKQLAVSGPRAQYTHDLSSGREFVTWRPELREDG